MTFSLVKHNNNSLSAITSAGNLTQGKMTLIKTVSASNVSGVEFVHGSSDVILDSTYPIYLFKFINIHPATDNTHLQIYFSTNSGSGYSIATQTTFVVAYHNEAGDATTLDYFTGSDAANQTGGANMMNNTGNDNDQSGCMEFYLFNPSSTTFLKNFIMTNQYSHQSDYSQNHFVSGYANTTSAVNAVKWTYSSGNVDSATVKLYGIKGS
jgi:hypothetical protein